MRCYFSPLAVTLALLLACSSQAAEKPRPAQSKQNQPKKVWTNDDMEELSARGLISIVGQESPAPATQNSAGPAESGPNFPVYESRLDDPEWYADQAASLQAELDKRMADLQQQQEALAAVKDRITQPGLALDKPDAGVTPAAGLANLEAQVQETQSRLDELSDLAHQHNIPPGVLRS
jgi:hypothetical protein